MIKINPNDNSERDNYKLLIASVVPRPIAFVTSVSPTGVLNGAPFSYFNIVSSEPPLMSIAVQRRDGVRKDTAKNIALRGEFVVHIVDEENVSQINETASRVGADVSEVQLANLTSIDSEIISVPGVREAKIRMECVVERIVELGGDRAGVPSCDLIIGRIVYFHIDKNIFDNGKINPRSLNAVSRLAGNDYAKIGHIFTKKRPE